MLLFAFIMESLQIYIGWLIVRYGSEKLFGILTQKKENIKILFNRYDLIILIAYLIPLFICNLWQYSSYINSKGHSLGIGPESAYEVYIFYILMFGSFHTISRIQLSLFGVAKKRIMKLLRLVFSIAACLFIAINLTRPIEEIWMNLTKKTKQVKTSN